ncbi:type VI secretion system-associated FHA domain protein TagH [Rhodoferax sp. 4810]|uniref:Type VI secretion system-associated FHA domain protein TagH n=1 Tax=Thiospirillum jenense TaxID=1653858 RepID=A0A839HE38_9GAMM|nr:type VI secretion system-associated FHA domain protein TagH [Thiospirillum jenense]MBB1074205.1 type VI secretion system-associated FHA domain protein TagH [Rhodoferax jenense]MBB1125279.1 type VI secretion system-associated FHA domain protein TagH [Thiospirillum jenense]
MYLKLTLSDVQAQLLNTDPTIEFHYRGGTIGRTRDNDWVLSDPERVVSSHHARVLYYRGSYYVEDTSANGTFLNQTETILPKGRPTILAHGDTLYISDYAIQVELLEESTVTAKQLPPSEPLKRDATEATIPLPATESLFDLPPSALAVTQPLPATTIPPLNEKVQDMLAETMPLPATNTPIDILAATMPSPGVTPPIIGNKMDELAATLPLPVMPANLNTVDPLADTIPSLTPFPAAAVLNSPMLNEQLLTAFFQGLGITPPATLTAAESTALFEQLGRLFRLFTQGMIDVLQARAAFKSRLRAAPTLIKPTENNPLKFSPNAEQALSCFIEKRTGFLDAEAAFTEAFTDIQKHEQAVVLAMQIAMIELLQQVSPATVETERLSNKQTARLSFNHSPWAFYQKYHAALQANLENDFYKFIGQEFARAYEEKLK